MHLSKNKFTYTKVFLWVNFTTRTIGEKAGFSMDVKISDQIVISLLIFNLLLLARLYPI